MDLSAKMMLTKAARVQGKKDPSKFYNNVYLLQDGDIISVSCDDTLYNQVVSEPLLVEYDCELQYNPLYKSFKLLSLA